MRLTISSHLQGSDQSAWLALWESIASAHPRQHPIIAELESYRRRQPVYLGGWRGDELVAAGVFSMRRMWPGIKLEGACLRGPLFSVPDEGAEFLKNVIGWAERTRIGRLRVTPFWRHPEAAQVELMLRKIGFAAVQSRGSVSGSTGLIDLTREIGAILKGFAGSARYQIRLAERVGVSIEPSQDDDEFFACFRSMQVENGIPAASRAEVAAMHRIFAEHPELGIALEARLRGEFMGGLWMFRSPHCAVATKFAVRKGKISPEDPNLSVGPALFWAAIQWAKASGCAVFDVDGYHPSLPPGHPCHAFCEFKKRLRPEHSLLVPEHVIVCSRVVDRIGRTSARGQRVLTRVRMMQGARRQRNRSDAEAVRAFAASATKRDQSAAPVEAVA